KTRAIEWFFLWISRYPFLRPGIRTVHYPMDGQFWNKTKARMDRSHLKCLVFFDFSRRLTATIGARLTRHWSPLNVLWEDIQPHPCSRINCFISPDFTVI